MITYFPLDLETFKKIITENKSVTCYSDYYYDIPDTFPLLNKNWYLVARVTYVSTLSWFLRKFHSENGTMSIEYDEKQILSDIGITENNQSITLDFLVKHGFYAVGRTRTVRYDLGDGLMIDSADLSRKANPYSKFALIGKFTSNEKDENIHKAKLQQEIIKLGNKILLTDHLLYLSSLNVRSKVLEYYFLYRKTLYESLVNKHIILDVNTECKFHIIENVDEKDRDLIMYEIKDEYM